WPRFQQCMTKFKNNADAAEIFETGVRCFRINDRKAVGQRRLRLMMIEHDYVDTAFPKVGDFLHRRGAAIDSNRQFGPILSDTTLYAFLTQAIALLHAQRQK